MHQFFAYFVAQWLDLMLGDVGHPQAHYGGVCEADLDQFVVQLLLEAANSFLDGWFICLSLSKLIIVLLFFQIQYDQNGPRVRDFIRNDLM